MSRRKPILSTDILISSVVFHMPLVPFAEKSVTTFMVLKDLSLALEF